MNTKKYATKEEWLADRPGKITGTTLGDVASSGGATKDMISEELTAQGVEFKKADKKEILQALLSPESRSALLKKLPKKMGFFRLLAERLALPPDEEEDAMERGSLLEKEAIEKLEERTGKKFNTDLVMWSREDNESIAISPDGFVDEPVVTEAAEVKALGSASHIKAWYTKEVPEKYWWQVLQYFIVNSDLLKLYFTLYDPRIPTIELVVIEITREMVQEEVTEYLAYEQSVIEEVNAIVNQLTF